MPYAAIVLAREDWIKAASEGKVSIYHFPKGRKPNVHKLEKGSICVVMKYPSPHEFVGEFEVEEVKLLNHEEYRKFSHLMHNPEILKPGEKAYVIFFDKFKKYPKPVPKNECTDIRTSTKKPLSDWSIIGFVLIKPQDATTFIQAIRSKARVEPPEKPPSHKDLVEAICNIGKILSFVVTPEHPTPGGLYRLDCTWTDCEGHAPLKVFEIETSGNVDRALARLKEAWDQWHPELYLIVSDESSFERAKALVDPHLRGSFATLKDKVLVLSWKETFNLYRSISQHSELLKKLSKR